MTEMSKARRRRLWRRVKRKRVLYLMLLPGMLLLLIFHYIPMWGVLIAFKDYRVLKGILASDWVGLKHFRAFFGGRMFSSVVLNTLILNCYSLIFAFPLPLVFALMLNEVRVDWFKKGVQTITYMPHFISTVVIVGMMKELLSPTNGIVNQILMRMGHEPIYFFGKAGYFRSLYIISGAWAGTGWGSIVYLAAITAVDVSLYEAATIDGASRLPEDLARDAALHPLHVHGDADSAAGSDAGLRFGEGAADADLGQPERLRAAVHLHL